jgi:hypothetical protein
MRIRKPLDFGFGMEKRIRDKHPGSGTLPARLQKGYRSQPAECTLDRYKLIVPTIYPIL